MVTRKYSKAPWGSSQVLLKFRGQKVKKKNAPINILGGGSGGMPAYTLLQNGIPANRPDLIGIVPIFEFQNLKNRDIPIFKRKKRHFLL